MSEDLVAVGVWQPRPRSKLSWLGWIFIVGVIVAPRIFDLNVFYARDELAIWPWADEFSLAVWAGDPAATLTTSDYPGIPMFWAQTLFLTFKYSFPALFPQTALPLEKLTQDRSLDLLAERRLAAGLLVSLQLIGAVWLVRRLWGWPVALLAAILLGLDPFSLSEARLLRLEMVSALFVCLSLLFYLFYLRRRRPALLFWSGVMAGLGVSSKTSAGLLVPYIWLLLLLDFFLATEYRWPQKFKRLIGNGLLWAGGAIAAFWAIWPAMWVEPLAAIRYIFLTGFSQAANRSVWGDEVFFWGQIVKGGDPGPFFYPLVFAFRTTPLIWAGTASALILLGLIIWQRAPKVSSGLLSEPPLWGRSWPVLSIGLLLAFVILITAEITQVISKVDRFLLLVFPALDILSALGLVGLIEGFAGHISRIAYYVLRIAPPVPHITPHASRFIASLLILVVLLLQLSITLPVHPYFFTYWNSWAGGGRMAMKVLPIGAGEGIDEAVNYLNNQPDAAEKTLVCGASEPWCSRIFKGKTVRSANYFDGRWVEADYASFYISQLQRQNYPPEVVDFFMRQSPLYRVDLADVDYVWVYTVPDMGHYAGRANNLTGLGQLLGYTFVTPGGETAAKSGETVEAKVWWTNLGGGVDNLLLRWVDESGYEWGRARVTPLAEYAATPATQRAIVAGTARLTIPLGTPPGLYFWRIGVTAPGEERLLGEFNLPDEANKLVVQAGSILTESDRLDMSERLDQTLAPEVTLLGYDPPTQALTAAVPTWLTLYWQATAPAPDYQVTLRLLNSAGQEVTRWQGAPGQGHYPTKNWRPGEIVKDVWALQVPPGTPVGTYDLEIYLTNPAQPQTSNPAKGTQAKSHISALEVLPQPVRYKAPQMQAKLQANFGQRLTLLGYDFYFNTSGGMLAPVFYWQSQADFEGSYDLLLTLRAADTAQIVKEWRVPLGAGEAKGLWQKDEVVETGYRLKTDGFSQGRYHLDLALQNTNGNPVEPVEQPDGRESTFVRIENIQDKIVVRVGAQ